MSDMISFSISLYMARKASLSVDDMIQWGRLFKASVLCWSYYFIVIGFISDTLELADLRYVSHVLSRR